MRQPAVAELGIKAAHPHAHASKSIYFSASQGIFHCGTTIFGGRSRIFASDSDRNCRRPNHAPSIDQTNLDCQLGTHLVSHSCHLIDIGINLRMDGSITLVMHRIALSDQLSNVAYFSRGPASVTVKKIM
jgi:hypothetical protein